MISFLLVIAVSFFVWWIRVYKYKFRIFEDIGGNGYEEVRTIRGRLLSIPGSLNEKVYWLPKEKIYLTAYGRKMGKNLYWLFIGPDGWYYNVVATDLDTKTGVLDIDPVDNDVRAFHTSNQKNIKERYEKPKNWPIILMSFTIIFAIILLIIGGYVITKKQNEGLSTIAGAQETGRSVVEASERVVVAVERLINSGELKPGLIEAPPS